MAVWHRSTDGRPGASGHVTRASSADRRRHRLGRDWWPRVLMALAIILWATPSAVAQEPPEIPGTRLGRVPERGSLRLLPWEHIDTYTGNTVLTFDDLVLPGNGGYDLRVVRTFNSLSLEWRWSFAPLLQPSPTNPGSLDAYPVILHEDGRHEQVLGTAVPRVYTTTSFWRITRTATERKIELPNGLVWYYTEDGWPTHRVDPYGNTVEVRYDSRERVDRLRQQIGGQIRDVYFEYLDDTQDLLHKITYNYTANGTAMSRVWQYDWGWMQVDIPESIGPDVPVRVMTAAHPPKGGPWTFDYTRTLSLEGSPWTNTATIRTPSGGWVKYTSHDLRFPTQEETYSWTHEMRIRNRQAGRTAKVEGQVVDIVEASWDFDYSLDNCPNYECGAFTDVSGPGGFKANYEHRQFHQEGVQGGMFVIRTVSIGAETITTLWEAGAALGTVENSAGNRNYALLPSTITTSRDGRHYSRSFRYAQGGNNNFGQPILVKDAGDFDRWTKIHYKQFGGAGQAYLADRVEMDIVFSEAEGDPESGDVSPKANTPSFERHFAYDEQGFMTSKNVYGPTTSYARDGFGRLEKVTDANSKETTFTYDWGVVQNTVTQEYTIERVINEDGTVYSETRKVNGADETVRFDYDSMGRQTTVTPPSGAGANTTVTSYSDTSVVVTRGSSVVTTLLDEFGRPSKTHDSKGVTTRVEYDQAGRKKYESNPYYVGPDKTVDSRTPDVGTHFMYDVLGRVTRRTNADDSVVTYSYGSSPTGLTVTVRNENQQGEEDPSTTQTWQSSGTPDGGRLKTVVDASGATWTYEYDILDALTKVIEPGGLSRTWVYSLLSKLANGPGRGRAT